VIVDRAMTARIDGVKGSTWFRLLDQVDVQLARGDLQAASNDASALQRNLRKNRRVLGQLIRLLTQHPTAGQVARVKLAIVRPQMTAAVDGVPASTWFVLLDRVNVDLTRPSLKRLQAARTAERTLVNDLRRPAVTTGAASSINQTSAAVSGTVSPHGRSTTYYFEYGTSTSYGSQTGSQAAGSGLTTVGVSAGITGLSPATSYHYRLDAVNATGASFGSDKTFTTPASPGQPDAARAVATYGAMQKYFYAANVYSGDASSLYTQNYPQSGNHYSYLWAFSRALAGTITLAGMPSGLLGGASYAADVSERLTGLSRYWDGSGYQSYPPAPYGVGGTKYYDDAAWVGLSTAQNYSLTGDQTSLTDAENVFNFVYPGGWGGGESFDPGGVYWVQLATNHSRTTNSNAPNAEIALLLENFDPANASKYDAGAQAIYGWANQYLYNVSASANYDPSKPALMFDSVTNGNTINKNLYTYNQGAMIAANVREYQKTGQSTYLSEAEAIANTALSTFNESYYINGSAAFNSIFFRGLLVLYPYDASLQSTITQTIQTYADDAWNNYRSSQGLFRFPSSQGTGYQLLDQGAMLQIYAMLAWNPSDYGKLP
jgi:hypothetical protein